MIESPQQNQTKRKDADSMINPNNEICHTSDKFSDALKELQIGKLLRRSTITKSFGISAYEVFQFLLLLVVRGRICFVS